MATGFDVGRFEREEKRNLEALYSAHHHIDNLSFTKAKEIYAAIIESKLHLQPGISKQYVEELTELHKKLQLYALVCSARMLHATQQYAVLYEKVSAIADEFNQMQRLHPTSILAQHVRQQYELFSDVLLDQLGIQRHS